MTPLLLSIICVIEYCQSITNSSGQYITIPSLGNNKSNSITCDHSTLCYVYCAAANRCANLTMTMHSERVIINCTYCDYLNVYAENATDFIMQYNSSNGGEFHINNVRNVFIDYRYVKNSVIYAQYVERFNLNQTNNGLYNVFYLDHVSKEINFILQAASLDFWNNRFMYNTIIASNAYQFNLYAYVHYGIYGVYFRHNIIYCPYNHAGACNLNRTLNLRDWEIFMPSPTLHADMFLLPLRIDEMKVWCNMNDDGKYESYTNIFWDHRLENPVCSNITSECCFLNTPATNEIFCLDNMNGFCSIDCSQNKLECNNAIIYPKDSTKNMHVICNGQYSCHNTYIYCPQTIDSTCQVSCVDNETSCYFMVIRFHANNKHMVLNAKNCRFCRGIQVFVDGNPNNYHLSDTSNASIICHSSYCYDMGITLNAPINNLHIIASDFYGYSNLDVLAEMADNILVYCNQSCSSINLKGKTDTVHSITIKCSCGRINVLSPLEYKLDYLSIPNGNNTISYYSKAVCDYSQQRSSISTREQMPCSDNFFCCPFSNVFEKEIYCNENQDCSITLHNQEIYSDGRHKPIIIYADYANSLAIICDKCSFINIFAINANNVKIECVNNCHDIHLNAMNSNEFQLKCNDECFNLVIDVDHAQNVLINANTLYETQIYALNGNNFNLYCNNCSKLDLAVPSDYKTFIHCRNDVACSKFNIYNNKWDHISMNITITNCYNAMYGMDSYWIDQFQWTVFCPSTVKVIHDNTYCKSHSRLQNAFCKCGIILNNTENISLNITSYQPFSDKCYIPIQSSFQIFHITVGSLFAIISFLIIILWSIVGTKYIFLKLFNPYQYHAVTIIEPPTTYLLNYIHLSDILIWIFNIYIVLLSYAVYEYTDEICSMDEKPFNWKEICLKTSLCDIYDDECVFNKPVRYIWISIDVGICIAVLTILLYICRCCADDYFLYSCRCRKESYDAEESLLLRNYVIDISHFVCLRSFRKKTWKHHYLNRKFFPVSPNQFCFLLMPYNIWGKYLVLFIPLLVLYIGFNDASFGIEWYDVLPMLFVCGLNEIIKHEYRILPPYDIDYHIQFVLNSVYGESLGGIILSFLKKNQEMSGTPTDSEISMERYGMISGDAQTEIDKSERHHSHQQTSTARETEIERLL